MKEFYIIWKQFIIYVEKFLLCVTLEWRTDRLYAFKFLCVGWKGFWFYLIFVFYGRLQIYFLHPDIITHYYSHWLIWSKWWNQFDNSICKHFFKNFFGKRTFTFKKFIFNFRQNFSLQSNQLLGWHKHDFHFKNKH